METNSRKNGRSVPRRGKKAAGGGKRDVDALLDQLKRFKVEHFKDGDFEIKLSPLAYIPEIKGVDKSKEFDEELLFYSGQTPPHLNKEGVA